MAFKCHSFDSNIPTNLKQHVAKRMQRENVLRRRDHFPDRGYEMLLSYVRLAGCVKLRLPRKAAGADSLGRTWIWTVLQGEYLNLPPPIFLKLSEL